MNKIKKIKPQVARTGRILHLSLISQSRKLFFTLVVMGGKLMRSVMAGGGS